MANPKLASSGITVGERCSAASLVAAIYERALGLRGPSDKLDYKASVPALSEPSDWGNHDEEVPRFISAIVALMGET